EAGRRRAREAFDWPVVYAQYQDLWADLNARRAVAQTDPTSAARLEVAPQASAARLDPYQAFGHYPTSHIEPATRLTLAPGATREGLEAVRSHPLFTELPASPQQLGAIHTTLEAGPRTLAEVAIHLSLSIPVAARAAGVLAKMGIVQLS